MLLLNSTLHARDGRRLVPGAFHACSGDPVDVDWPLIHLFGSLPHNLYLLLGGLPVPTRKAWRAAGRY
jgi:hypothetical protein